MTRTTPPPRRRLLAALAALLPSLAAAPMVAGGATLLTLIPAGRAMAETVCSKAGTELDFVNQPTMQNSRDKLENPNYFGPGGAVAPETFDFAALPVVSQSTLVAAGCDIFVGGGFGGSLTVVEGVELFAWSQGPRDTMVIGGCDLDTDNQTCLAMGRTLSDIPNGGVELEQSLAYNPLTCGGADAVATYGGRSTFLGLGPVGTDITLAYHDTVGREPAVTTDSLVNPSLLMTADADMFGSTGSVPIGAGPIAASNQAVFVLNVFKFALDGLNGRLANPQCVESYDDRSDLEIALSASAATASFGDTLTLDVQVANVLGLPVDGVAVAVSIPAGFRLLSASGIGAYDAGAATWTPGALAVGGSETLTLSLEAIAPGPGDFRAEIVGSSLPDTDSAPNSSFDTDDLADGLADDDEATLSLSVLAADRSDAPIGGEAVHQIAPGMFLGAGPPDSDVPALAGPGAIGDDLDGVDDEDGVTLPVLIPGEVAPVSVAVSGAGFLQAWVDFDGDGSFGPAEQIAVDRVDDDGDGLIALAVAVPPGAATAPSFARFRWSSDPAIGPTGFAPDGEVEDYAVTFAIPGPVLSGRVFLDNGAGGGTAHDGFMQGGEAGIAAATVTILDAGGATLASPTVAADGTWRYALPAAHAGPVGIAVLAPGLAVVGERVDALPALSNAAPLDGAIIFTPAPGQSYATLDTGLVAPPALDDDNTATVAPGGSVSLRHRYRATTAGDVVFSFTDTAMVPANGFSAALFLDPGCDGSAGAALGGAVAVTAGQTLCLVSRVVASGGAGPGARLTYTLRARTALAGLPLALDATDADTVTVSDGGAVVLAKTVRNVTTGSAETATNAGDLGDILEYRITVTNPGDTAASAITVRDITPAYTRLAAPVPSPLPLGPDATCAVAPPAPAIGHSGPIRWDCVGTLPPGATGAVTFRVRIEP